MPERLRHPPPPTTRAAAPSCDDTGPSRRRAALLALVLAGAAPATMGAPDGPMAAAATAPPAIAPAAVRPGRLDPFVRPRRIVLEVELLGPALDARMTRFRGDASLEFIVTRPTRTIELHASGLRVEASALDDEPIAAPQASADGQRLRWTLPQELPVGDHRLSVVYEGTLGTDADGLYRIDSPSPAGTRHVLATQMEPTGARRLLPLWDEPGYRVPYELSVVMPAGLAAVSNTPVIERVRLPPAEAGGPPRERVLFAATPSMPSYLLALFAGPFETLDHPRTAPRLRAYTMPGRTREAALALHATDTVLDVYRDYFGQPYTLDKLDSVALPGGFGGAMENWGAIAYNESTLLHDPATSPAGRRMDVWGIVAHEVAHQWFGNLVTMGWWDDLWLNEGFATWMAARTVQQLHPDEPVWADAAVGIDRAMTEDALPGSSPVLRPVLDDRAAFASFDEITYEKGMAFVRMLEQWLGPEVFRDGLRRYMATHALGNATTADLWRELSAVSGRPVARIADAWVRRSGLPRIDVDSRCVQGRLEVTLRQSPFRTGPRAGGREAAMLWPVPLTLGRYGDDGRLLDQRRVFLDTAAHDERFDGCAGAIKANLEGAGYYRSRASAADAARLSALFPRLPETERLNLLADRWALALAGDGPIEDWLALAGQLGGETSPAVWRHVREATLRLLAVMGPATTEADRRWRARLAAVAATRLQALGLRPPEIPTGTEAERDRDGQTRNLLIGLLGRLDHAPTVAAVRGLWDETMPATATTLDGLPAGIRRSVLFTIGRHADRATHERLRRLAAAEGDAAQREWLWSAIASVRDPALAPAVARLAADEATPPDVAPWLLADLAESGHGELAWRALDRDAAKIFARATPWTRGLLAPAVRRQAAGERAAAELLAWQRRRVGAEAEAPARSAAGTIVVNGSWKARVQAPLQRWGAKG